MDVVNNFYEFMRLYLSILWPYTISNSKSSWFQIEKAYIELHFVFII